MSCECVGGDSVCNKYPSSCGGLEEKTNCWLSNYWISGTGEAYCYAPDPDQCCQTDLMTVLAIAAAGVFVVGLSICCVCRYCQHCPWAKQQRAAEQQRAEDQQRPVGRAQTAQATFGLGQSSDGLPPPEYELAQTGRETVDGLKLQLIEAQGVISLYQEEQQRSKTRETDLIAEVQLLRAQLDSFQQAATHRSEEENPIPVRNPKEENENQV